MIGLLETARPLFGCLLWLSCMLCNSWTCWINVCIGIWSFSRHKVVTFIWMIHPVRGQDKVCNREIDCGRVRTSEIVKYCVVYLVAAVKCPTCDIHKSTTPTTITVAPFIQLLNPFTSCGACGCQTENTAEVYQQAATPKRRRRLVPEQLHSSNTLTHNSE